MLNLLTNDRKRKADQEQQQRQEKEEAEQRQLEEEQQQQKEQAKQGEVEEEEEEQPALFGLASNLESSLNYAQLLLTLITQIDETVLVFLIVMLICGIVYACEYARHTHTHIQYILNSPSLSLSLSPTVLLCILSKPAMNEIFLVLVSYVILGTFLAIEIAVSYAMQPRLVWRRGRERREGKRVSSFSQLLSWSEINHGISCGTLIVSKT